MLEIHSTIEKAIHKSQHCQRNWDLTKEIPQEDMDLILTALTQCPSKQNVSHYKVHAITNRDIIERIHAYTDGFTISIDPHKTVTNTQVLANLLIVMERVSVDVSNKVDAERSDETYALANGELSPHTNALMKRDCYMAVGVAAGYVNLTASLLGYSTGCCACFLDHEVRKILGTDNEILLMMGVGFKDPTLPRRVSHIDHKFVFPTMSKQKIEVQLHR